jgi:hypothetical protein
MMHPFIPVVNTVKQMCSTCIHTNNHCFLFTDMESLNLDFLSCFVSQRRKKYFSQKLSEAALTEVPLIHACACNVLTLELRWWQSVLMTALQSGGKSRLIP